MTEDFSNAELQDNQVGWEDRLTDRMERMGFERTRQKLAGAVFIRGHRPFVQAWLDEKKEAAERDKDNAVLQEMKNQTDAARTSASAALGSMYMSIVAALIAVVAAIYTAMHALK